MSAPRASATERGLTLALAGDAETDRLGAWFAADLKAGDTLLLAGPIGAGKTHFARALITERLRLEGQAADVPSPTFTLVQTYETAEFDILHADLYRLGPAGDIAELGLDDMLGEGICLIEWPDRLGALAPGNALSLHFAEADGGQARIVTFGWSGVRWRKRMDDLLRTWDLPG